MFVLNAKLAINLLLLYHVQSYQTVFILQQDLLVMVVLMVIKLLLALALILLPQDAIILQVTVIHVLKVIIYQVQLLVV